MIDTKTICEHPLTPGNFECQSCNLDLNECDCLLDETVFEIDVRCVACDKTYMDVSVYGLLGIQEEPVEDDDVYNNAQEQGSLFNTKEIKRYITYSNKCRHYNVPVTMKDGTIIYASSAHRRKSSDPAPDFGMYLDGMWDASCLAYTVDWPDFGIPRKFSAAVAAIIDVYNKARNGLWVEVGCIGGHGRTGTALACMAVLGGMTSSEAISHIRDTYCDRAIESADQEWFVDWFDKYINGGSVEMWGWNKKKKQQVLLHTWDFPAPAKWKDIDPHAKPAGAPPLDIQVTIVDEYVSVPYFDKKKKQWGYATIDSDEKDFEYFHNEYLAQEAARAEEAKNAAPSNNGSQVLTDF